MTDLTICKCGCALDTYVQPLHPLSTRTPQTYGTCRNQDCAKFEITRELAELAAMSDAEVQSCKGARAAGQAIYEKRMEG